MAALYRKHKDDGLEIIGICMDEVSADGEQASEDLGMSWPQVIDGKGPYTEAALRYAVDVPPRMVLIGRNGEVAALHVYPFDEASTVETEAAIIAALQARE